MKPGDRFKTFKGELWEVVNAIENSKLLIRCIGTGKLLEVNQLSITVGLATGLFAQCKERSYENIG